MDKSQVAIVSPSGFDGGGSAMLSYQWRKLGFPSFFKDHCKKHIKPFPGVSTYKSGELLSIMKKSGIRRVIIMSMLNQDVKRNYDELKSLHDSGIETWLVNCQRMEGNSYARNSMEMLKEYGGLFLDKYLFLSDNLAASIAEEYHVSTLALNMNAYVFGDDNRVPLPDRDNTILSIGRGEAFKGVPYYFNSIPEIMRNDLSSKWSWVHEGFTHEWKMDDGNVIIGGSIQAIQALSNGFPDKIQHPWINAATSISDDSKILSAPRPGVMNVYSTYNFEDSIDRHRHALLAVCPTLGRVEEHKISYNIFGQPESVMKSREDRRICKAESSWETAMEYANIELIDFSVPVLFSTDYANTLLTGNGQSLKDSMRVPTYDWYGEIPSIVSRITSSDSAYNNFITEQRESMIRIQDGVNNHVIESFTENF